MTAAELAAKLAALPPDTIVSVWDPFLDQQCHVDPSLDLHPAGVVLIESNAQVITEEDVS